MKILAVEVQGFRSFAAPQRWTLDAYGHGLHYLTGRNEVEPDLEANGTGKSSLFEALFLCFFGKTSRGLRAGNIQCWLPGAPKCNIAVDVQLEMCHVVTIKRSFNPNKILWLDGAITNELDQPELERKLGISPEAFLHTQFFAQHAPTFVDVGATDRLGLLSEVLRLEQWERASEIASDKAGKLRAELDNKQLKAAEMEGRLSQLQQSDFTNDEKQWETKRDGDIKQLEEALAALGTWRLRRKESIAKRAEEYFGEGLAATTNHKGDQYRKDIAQHENDIRKYERKLDQITADINRLKKAQAEMLNLEGATCTRCKQPVNKRHAEKEVKLLQKEIDALESQSEPTRLGLEQATDLAAAVKEQMLAEANAIADGLEAFRRLGAVRTKMAKQHAEANAQAKQIRAQLERLRKEPNPFTTKAEEQRVTREKLEAVLAPLQKDMAEIEPLIKGMDYWTKGFKEVRLFIVQQVLAQLEIEVNNTLVQLGLIDWSVRFTVEQENKDGKGVKRGLAILINSPHSTGAVPFEVWSGGEAQRLRLAISMGLANLITAQIGFECNVEFWDEPFKHMSNVGVYEGLQVLRDRALALGKSIWLADHNALDYGGFAGSICMVKRGAGSVIEGTSPITKRSAPPPKTDDRPASSARVTVSRRTRLVRQ